MHREFRVTRKTKTFGSIDKIKPLLDKFRETDFRITNNGIKTWFIKLVNKYYLIYVARICCLRKIRVITYWKLLLKEIQNCLNEKISLARQAPGTYFFAPVFCSKIRKGKYFRIHLRNNGAR